MHIVTVIPNARYRAMITEETDAFLDTLGQITRLRGDTQAVGAAAPTALQTAEILLTGWGTPTLQENWLTHAPRLKLICHCAGSVRGIVPPAVFSHGIQVTHAAPIIADAVAEFCILTELTLLRQLRQVETALTGGRSWGEAKRIGTAGHLLGAQRVGLVGAGYVAQRHIRLLKAFGAHVRVYDPFLSPERAAGIGADKIALDELFAGSTVIVIHAPKTPETHHMIGSAQLALIQPGAVLIQNSRSWVLDEQALLHELETGRFAAAIDVFDTEPLPAGSRFFQLPNVLITPHIAGATQESYARQGRAMAEEAARFIKGEPLHYRILPEQFDQLA
ncbi:MAG: hydroxyacid dehydrogenase [Chloroflexi bacterium]|nr:hydroxyacid dehydrogenase [Chloroflexota bacterium]